LLEALSASSICVIREWRIGAMFRCIQRSGLSATVGALPHWVC